MVIIKAMTNVQVPSKTESNKVVLHVDCVISCSQQP